MGVYIWKERLPSAYQEVEYIQSSGNGTNSGQFIKPGVSIEAGTKLKIEIDFQRLNQTTAERNIFAQYTGDTNRFQLGFLEGGFQARLNSATNGTLSVTWTPNTYAYNTRYLAIAEGTSNVASSRPPFLFAQNEGDSYGRWCISAKLYYCKIRKDSILVRYFIPCYRKSDGVIGLYDLVNSAFYTNQGSGTFTKGQNISYVEHPMKNNYIGEYIAPVSVVFSYTGSDQHYTIPNTGLYKIIAKGAGSNTSTGGLGQGEVNLTKGDVISIMVGQSGSSTSSGTYGFGGTSNYGSNRSGGGLSGVFTGSETITATSASRALVIGGGAGAGGRGAGGAGGGETGANGASTGYGNAGGGGTQTGRNSGGNVGANQFNGGNGSGTYGYGGGGGWYGGNSSVGDSSADDDRGAGGGSGYVISTASNRILTQGGGAVSGNNGSVEIIFVP